MSRLAIEMLENSRLAEVIGQVERGEEVDVERTLTLQALDVVRAGELFLADALKREDEADEQFKQLLEEICEESMGVQPVVEGPASAEGDP